MAASDLSRRALLARATILDPGIETAKVLAATYLPRKRTWANLLAHYRYTRKLMLQLSDDEEMFDLAVQINDEAFFALEKVAAPTLADAVTRFRIIIRDHDYGSQFDTVLADLDRLLA